MNLRKQSFSIKHSFATKMKIDGVAVTMISDCLGHTTTTTIEHYMKSLPDEYIKEMSSNLLEFDNDKGMIAI